MGAKFYRGSDKPKKIRKRFTQTRSWFRTLKWVACKKFPLFLTDFNTSIFLRSRASNYGCWPPLQGFMGVLHWPTTPPRREALRTADRCAVQATLPRQEPIR